MANSDWASEAFGPLHETQADKARVDVAFEAIAAEDAAALRLHEELEYVNECESCRAWVFGTGLACEQHNPNAEP